MTEREAQSNQFLLDFLKRLTAKVTNLHHFFLVALNKLFNGVDACALEAVVGTPVSEELEKLKHKQYVAERKLTAAKHKEKRLQSELKRLTRGERTHRLCTRAGMLETFLREPTILTDDDVMELLTFIFHSEAVQKKLNLLIENRKNELTTDSG